MFRDADDYRLSVWVIDRWKWVARAGLLRIRQRTLISQLLVAHAFWKSGLVRSTFIRWLQRWRLTVLARNRLGDSARKLLLIHRAKRLLRRWAVYATQARAARMLYQGRLLLRCYAVWRAAARSSTTLRESVSAMAPSRPVGRGGRTTIGSSAAVAAAAAVASLQAIDDVLDVMCSGWRATLADRRDDHDAA